MNDLHKLKWLPCAAGGLMCLLGLGCLVWPQALAGVLSILIGACILAFGLGLLAVGLAGRRSMPNAGILLVQGGVNLAVGCVFLFNQDVSVAFLGLLLGIWLLILGALQARRAWAYRRVGLPWKGKAASAALRAGCGVLALLRPFAGVQAGVMLLGAVQLMVGASVIAGALFVDRALGQDDSLDEWIDDSFGSGA